MTPRTVSEPSDSGPSPDRAGGGARSGAPRYVSGPAAAFAEVDTLAGALDGYHLFHTAAPAAAASR